MERQPHTEKEVTPPPEELRTKKIDILFLQQDEGHYKPPRFRNARLTIETALNEDRDTEQVLIR